MPVAVIDIFVTWHCLCGGLLYGPPYLSTIACVTQTWLVRGGICGMFWGPPDTLICGVPSPNPRLLHWPCACAASATMQQPRIIKNRVLCIQPPRRAGEGSALFDFIPSPARL